MFVRLVPVLLVLAVALSACSGDATQFAAQTPVPAAVDMLQLPAPSQLRGVSFNESDTEIVGAPDALTMALFPDFFRNVTASGNSGVFTPDWGATRSASDLAFSTYGFLGMEDFDRDKTIRLNWTASGNKRNAYVGVANGDRNAWDFYQCDDGGIATLNPANWTAYTTFEPVAGIPIMLVVVIVVDSQNWNLASLRLGEPPAATPPVIDSVSDSGEEGASVNITASLSGGAPDSYDWTFGTGISPASSSAASPAITLGGPGIVPCSLTVSNSSGSDTLNFNFTITPAATAPDLTLVNPTSGNEGDVISAEAINAGGNAATWAWDFGGGATPNTSALAMPEITLGSQGTYSCSVTATNSAGSSTLPFQLEINPAGEAPEVLSVSPLSGNSGANVGFIAFVMGSVDSYAWDFGGGASPNTSTAAAPTVTLGAAGTYSCSLEVTNAFGNHVFPFNLDVTGGLQPPQIVGITPGDGAQFTQVQFAAQNSGGAIDSWDWDFGGAGMPNTSTDESPLVTLGAAGPMPFTISVTATNAAGSDSFQLTTFMINPF